MKICSYQTWLAYSILLHIAIERSIDTYGHSLYFLIAMYFQNSTRAHDWPCLLQFFIEI